MGKEHFHLFPFAAGALVLLRGPNLAGDIPRVFMDAAGNLAHGCQSALSVEQLGVWRCLTGAITPTIGGTILPAGDNQSPPYCPDISCEVILVVPQTRR